MVKIKQEVLYNFLKKVKMSEEQQIDDIVLYFERDGLHAHATSNTKYSHVDGWLKSTAFVEYEAIGKVCLTKFNEVLKVLDRFKGGEVALSTSGNILRISMPSKHVDIEQVDESYIPKDEFPVDKFNKFIDKFEITADVMKEIFDDAGRSSSVSILISTEPQKVKFYNTGEYRFTRYINYTSCKGGASSKFGSPLIDCLKATDGALTIDIGDTYPIKVVEKKDESEITIIIAPDISDTPEA